jgi:hypothetical protein
MNAVSRRRFLLDLAFAGGGLALAVGLAWSPELSAETRTPSPSASPNKLPPKSKGVPESGPPPHVALPGAICPPRRKVSPTPRKTGDGK